MGICRDKATTYLARFGYNVVRHPRIGVRPLMLVGRQRRSTELLGSLDQLIKDPGPLPSIKPDEVAAGISGQETSKLDAAVGVHVLGNILGALGGKAAVKGHYGLAKTLQFTFPEVTLDSVDALEVSSFLTKAEVDRDSPLLAQYVLGRGNLYVITAIVKAQKFLVSAEAGGGGGVDIDAPAIQDVVGGAVVVAATGRAGAVFYEGKERLTFGFKCFEIGVENGVIAMLNARPGSLALALEADEAPTAAILEPDALLDFDDDPVGRDGS